MGWAHCGTNRHGQEIGYAIQSICDEPGCTEAIDRGLDYLCGEMHDDGETCNKYYCHEHLILGVYPNARCARCAKETDDGEELAEVPQEARSD
jgi:hypothetical protein